MGFQYGLAASVAVVEVVVGSVGSPLFGPADENALGHTGKSSRVVYSAVCLLAKPNSSPDKESLSTLIL